MSEYDHILIWGSGSQAMLYAGLAQDLGHSWICVDPRQTERPKWCSEGQFFGQAQSLNAAVSSSHSYIVAIGGEHGAPRHDISKALEKTGLQPISLVDPSSIIKSGVEVGAANYVAQGVVINVDVVLGRDVILNTACSIDHECQIGDGVHIMGAAAVAGRVTIQDFAVIGTNATILPDLTIGRGAFIGAGAVVTKDVAENSIVIGAPAREIRKRAIQEDKESIAWIEKCQP